jgi:hypothetical protein
MEAPKDPLKPIETLFDLHEDTSKDDKVEIVATLLGSFILGASFAKEFFLNGRFEIRIFLFGVSCFILFLAVSLVARIWIKLFDSSRIVVSCLWFFFFFLGNFAALDLFENQFLSHKLKGDLRYETIIFLASYMIATNLLYYLNRDVLMRALRQKTIYKYLLAPINGLSLGVIITGIIVWTFNKPS